MVEDLHGGGEMEESCNLKEEESKISDEGSRHLEEEEPKISDEGNRHLKHLCQNKT